jgi:hypothetical protein
MARSGPQTPGAKAPRRRNRQRAKSNSDAPRRLSIYDGQNCIGAIEVADDGTARAFDRRGKILGAFPSIKAATAAFKSSVAQAVRQA